MTKISIYNIDEAVTLSDKWIGSDGNAQNRTKNFSPQKLIDFFNESGMLGVVNQVSFKYYDDYLDARPIGSITTEYDFAPMSSLVTVKVSERNSGTRYIADILNTFVGNTIMIANLADPNTFGIYKLTDIEQDLIETTFYNLSLELVEANGILVNTNIYGITTIPNNKELDKNFVHVQGSAASQWSITHNLNKYPSVSVVDSGNNTVIGDVEYASLNSVTIRFSASFSGKAFFN